MSNTITPTVFYRTLNVEGLEIFYREAGPRDAPTVLLLHGFPSSSHMFRDLIPTLADNYLTFAEQPRQFSTTNHSIVETEFRLLCGDGIMRASPARLAI